MKISEILLLCSGLGILASVLIIFLTGNFALWVAAKVFYGIGTLLFVINR